MQELLLFPHRHPIPLLALLLLAALCAGVPAGAQRMAPGLAERAAVEGRVRVLVELEAGFSPEGGLDVQRRGRQRAAIARGGDDVVRRLGPRARRVRRFERIPYLAVEVGPEGLADLAAAPGVRSVQADLVLRPLLSDSLPAVDVPVVQTGYDGSGQVVVVIDSGVDAGHPFLAGKVIPAAEACFSSGGDCPNGQTVQYGAGAGTFCTWAKSNCSHGTHVSGIAVGNDGAGRVGVAPGADLIAVNVASLSTDPVVCAAAGENPCVITQTSDLILGLEHAFALRTSYDIAAVNVSLGGGQWSNQNLCNVQNGATKAAIDNLRSAGILTVAAAGNEGFVDAIGAPACISSAVSVAASTDVGTVPAFSNWAQFVTLLAPGLAIESSVPFALYNRDYKSFTGTSMSVPHVAGALALLRQALPGASSEQLLASLVATGEVLTHGATGQTNPEVSALGVIDDFLDACSNGIDDDLDTQFDFGSDPGCASPTDTDEHSSDACDNGIDDDGDGLVDFPDDPGCGLSLSDTESPSCDDDVDNDGDGRIDWDGGSGGGTPDPQCMAPYDTSEYSGCGLGFEAGVTLAGIAALRRRRRARATPRARA